MTPPIDYLNDNFSVPLQTTYRNIGNMSRDTLKLPEWNPALILLLVKQYSPKGVLLVWSDPPILLLVGWAHPSFGITISEVFRDPLA